MKIGILGCGLAGLELGKELKKRRLDFVIFEKEDEVGGLCRTMRHGHWRWDFGVHALYSKDQDIIDYFLSLPIQYEWHNRNVKVCHHKDGNIYVLDYPFENGLGNLPFEDKVDCILGYIEVKSKNKKRFSSLKEWIEDELGYGIAQHFMLPYNRKIWNCELNLISMDLVNNRIDPGAMRMVIESCLGKTTVGREYQARFLYPKEGIGELTRVLSKEILDKIRLNCKVEALRYNNKKWRIYYNEKKNYEEVDIIVSTIPMVELLKMLKPAFLKKPRYSFYYNDTLFFAIGLKNGKSFGRFRRCHWVFFAQNEIFYRITFMHNFSSKFAPCLVAEVTYKGNIKKLNPEILRRKVLEDLLRDEIISHEEDIGLVELYHYPYTYPIPVIEIEDLKFQIKKEFKKTNLFLLGRSGAWDYINMDGVITKVRNFMQNAKTFEH